MSSKRSGGVAGPPVQQEQSRYGDSHLGESGIVLQFLVGRLEIADRGFPNVPARRDVRLLGAGHSGADGVGEGSRCVLAPAGEEVQAGLVDVLSNMNAGTGVDDRRAISKERTRPNPAV